MEPGASPRGGGELATLGASVPPASAQADYVRPPELAAEAIAAAVMKANLPVPQMVVRGVLAGALLGFATSLALLAWAQGLPRLAGAVVFPVGFVMLVLLGLELATGNFALLPMALATGRTNIKGMLRNWFWVYLGNLAGSLLYAGFFYLAMTNMGLGDGGHLGEQVRQLASAKTLGYAAMGLRGWGLALTKGVLANWMVTVGTVLFFASRSVAGKVLAMWLPILTFFALGFEHSIVNMFLVPAGVMLGAKISLTEWWTWNQVPVTLGNVLGGGLLTGLALSWAYGLSPLRPRGGRAVEDVGA